MSKSNRSSFRLDSDLISLRALVAIDEERSFSAAAKRIGRSQSAVSLQIGKLETRVQAKLLERTSRSVRPTADGEILIAYARRILELADEAAIALSAPDVTETLRVGFAEYLAPQHLHDLLARFRRAHPKAGLALRLGRGFELSAALEKGHLDVVVAGPESRGGRIMVREPLVWIGATSEDTDRDGTVSLILMQPPCSYRQAAFDALTAAGRTWQVTMEANAIQGVQSAVAAGLGVSVIARSALTPNLRVLDQGYPALPDTAMVAYLPQKRRHPLAGRFLAFLEDGLGAYAKDAA